MSSNFEDRFWAKVKKKSGCWLWQASCFRDGYGQISRSDGGKRMNLRTHRVAWELSRGEIPDDICVLHSCDVRSCCNPSHLFLGTVADNMKDKCNKERQARGAAQGLSRLDADKVRKIRRMGKVGELSLRAIAREFGVNSGTVHYILNRKSWKHVD